MYPAKMTAMSEWSESLVTRMAETIRTRRQQLGLSVQDVADRTAALGHPLNRSTLSDLENGRRKDRLMLGDALALADALRVPLGTLLYPEMPDGEVEVLPGVTATSWEAANALIGVAGSYIETAPEGVDADQRRREYMSGRSLYPLSVQVLTLRQKVEELRLIMDRDDMRTNFEAISEGLKKIDEIGQEISEKAEMIRLMGGVVNDG